MKQQGESLLICILMLVALTGLVLLSSLELKKSFSLMERRSRLFLCTKETKGELSLYLQLMGKTNWAIKNINRLRLMTLFIPGLQGVSSNADKARRLIQSYQNYRLVSYLKTLRSIQGKGCPLDSQMLITPFYLALNGYRRDSEGVALVRKYEWTYFYFLKPYVLSIKLDLKELEGPSPHFKLEAQEKMGALSSLLLSP